MKQQIFSKRWIVSLLFILVTTLLWSYDVEIDGICYNVNKNNHIAEVTRKIKPGIATLRHLYYTGSIVTPENISVENETYIVKSIDFGVFDEPTVTSE